MIFPAMTLLTMFGINISNSIDIDIDKQKQDLYEIARIIF